MSEIYGIFRFQIISHHNNNYKFNKDNSNEEKLEHLRNSVLNINNSEQQDADISLTILYDILLNWNSKHYYAFSYDIDELEEKNNDISFLKEEDIHKLIKLYDTYKDNKQINRRTCKL